MTEQDKSLNLDALDREILIILQENGRISNANLARQIALSPPATHARLKRLEKQGIISRYAAILDRSKTRYDMLCFINVSLQAHQTENVEQFHSVIAATPEILECHQVTGEFDYLLKVIIKNQKDLERLVIDQLTPIPSVARIYTSLALTELKATTAIPLAKDE